MSRISGLAYGTVVSLIRAASIKGQLIHNQAVQGIETEEIAGCASDDGGVVRQILVGRVK